MPQETESWDAEAVRALRERMSLSQRELADELGVRQQTVSEWETGMYRPRGASARMLRVVAERSARYQPDSLPDQAKVTSGEQAVAPPPKADGRRARRTRRRYDA
jgi:transcriptional regulator with XRE-family HTH domain